LAETISQQAAALAAIDVASAQANLAIEQNYTRPVVDSSLAFHIEGGRHPVVESALRSGSETFSPNDCDLSDSQRIWLLTGPNMAGKSTFLRQNALIVIMAQAGFYVPATSAHIGMVDKVFSRVGAADDLARGRSTFMIEMVETATILNQSTSRSLVILDEIGRGTSTFDGLSIAWACLEYLHNISKCRGLFATHYHELTTLQETLPHLSCAKMEVREWKGDVIFLHSVSKGTADRSYGIHVAQLAGLPSAVTNRARDILALLEKGERASSLANLAHDLPLFNSPSLTRPIGPSEVEKSLRDINPDSLSPREALEALYQLKNLLKEP
jgi:DNA mismatch repair protein MutS